MALRFGRGSYGSLSTDLLFKERFQVVCAPAQKARIEHEIDRGNLDHVCFILDVGMQAGEHVTWDQWFEKCGLPFRQPERKMVCTDANTSIDAAVSGCGLLLGRHVLIGNLLEQGLLEPLDSSFESQLGYYLVYLSYIGLTPIARVFRDWVMTQSAQT